MRIRGRVVSGNVRLVGKFELLPEALQLSGAAEGPGDLLTGGSQVVSPASLHNLPTRVGTITVTLRTVFSYSDSILQSGNSTVILF
jgi:hypothetical protein